MCVGGDDDVVCVDLLVADSDPLGVYELCCVSDYTDVEFGAMSD